MPAQEFFVAFHVSHFYYEGNPVLKLKIRGNLRGLCRRILKDVSSIKKIDAKPLPQNARQPKVVVFDNAIAGLAAALLQVQGRLEDVLAKIP